MARVEEIKVVTNSPPAWRGYLRIVILFSLLTAAAAVPRILFGGAWIIDLIILVFLLVILYMWGRTQEGKDVRMSVEELQLWAQDGCPLDIKEWRKDVIASKEPS